MCTPYGISRPTTFLYGTLTPGDPKPQQMLNTLNFAVFVSIGGRGQSAIRKRCWSLGIRYSIPLTFGLYNLFPPRAVTWPVTIGCYNVLTKT